MIKREVGLRIGPQVLLKQRGNMDNEERRKRA